MCEWGRYAGQTVHLDEAMKSAFAQMDLMKMEMVSMVATKSAVTGIITYQLPPEKQHHMHDDRNYVAMMFCWWIQQLRSGEGRAAQAVDFQHDYIERVMAAKNTSGAQPGTQDVAQMIHDSSDPMAKYLRTVGETMGRGGKKSVSPFSGKNPFGKK